MHAAMFEQYVPINKKFLPRFLRKSGPPEASIVLKIPLAFINAI